jgi:hypothetical protein
LFFFAANRGGLLQFSKSLKECFMKSWAKFFTVALVFALGAMQAHAETVKDREFADIYTDCGLGAMIAPHNDAVAAVTNVTWDLGTTASSSNISSPGSCVGGKEKMATFIHESQDLLFSELATGNGQYLDALAIASDIEAAQKDDFIQAVRDDARIYVQSTNFDEMSRFERAETLYNIVIANLGSNS